MYTIIYTYIYIDMIYKTIWLHRGQRRFFPATMSENDLANEIVMQVFHWCHPNSRDFSCRGPSTWEVYMRQGSNPYSLAHSGGPSAEALDFFRTSPPPKKISNMMFFFGGRFRSCRLIKLRFHDPCWYFL